MVLDQVFLELEDVFVMHGALAEYKRWLCFLASWRDHQVLVEKARLLENVTEVDQARKG